MHQGAADTVLVRLLQALNLRGYSFVTPLNTTYRTIRSQPEKQAARDLRDVLGWSLPYRPGAIDSEIEAMLEHAGCVRDTPLGRVATVRVSAVHSLLFLHSAYPTREADAVFLGPGTYRFAEFLRTELRATSAERVLDLGAGAGVGGIIAARATGAAQTALCDINPLALRLASANAAHAGVPVRTLLSSALDDVGDAYDVIVANPPFIAGGGKTYNDGGGMHGAELSLAWAISALPRLRPRGRLLMYTGSAIIDGADPLYEALRSPVASLGGELAYRELDPDIFGEQLRRRAYAGVERIAAVGISVTMP